MSEQFVSIGEQVVSDEFLPKDPYVSPEWARLERERLWPKVWQVACRVEEVPEAGDFVEYQIAGESIIVIRSDEHTVQAFFNVCPHRGRRLLEGEGSTKQIRCGFHGWRWAVDGTCTHILDEDDFSFTCADVSLAPVRCDTWGGFVFVNMDPDAGPLLEHLSPLDEILGPFEFENLRFRWYKSTVLPCNWKMALDAFNEGYHVPSTHPQLLPFSDDRSQSQIAGDHAGFRNIPENLGVGIASPRVAAAEGKAARDLIVAFHDILERDLKAIYTERDWQAAQRAKTEMPEDATNFECMMQVMLWQREAALEDGAGWPEISMEQFMTAGTDWQIFPNTIVIQFADGMLCYRTRPNGDDPDSCIHDIWSLARYAPGTEPPIERHRFTDWHDHDWGRILTQDFGNMAAMQQGMHSRGFAGLLLNPRQEAAIANYHRVLRRYLFDA